MARTTGVAVKMIDLDKLAELFRNADNEADRETRKGVIGEYFMSTGVIYNPEGYMRTINDEGVSDRGLDEGTKAFRDSFAVYTWYGYIEFSRAQIESCLSDKAVDLAELIRVFGDRLERNFSLAHSWATGRIEGR